MERARQTDQGGVGSDAIVQPVHCGEEAAQREGETQFTSQA